ncbi:Ger(x)C family spore germination protein [Bacillus sp. 2205SS5-2]|uniref:Ger(x)C family spore germination protein n=1 Tax=Bacillus sp. 2205SS5-2 TaxID=3109031 RepID=UPI0030071D27
MKRFFLLFLLCLFLSACVEKEILDDLNIEGAIGYDLTDDKKILGTAIYSSFQSDKTIKNVTLSTQATASRDIMSDLELQSFQPLVKGSLEVVVISKDLSKNGIFHIADHLQRDASIGSRIFLAICDGKAQELLSGEYGHKGNAIYISKLIEHNIQIRDVPDSNLHVFLFDYFQKGKSPYIPIIKQTSPENVQISGLGLFKDDKYIDRIDSDQMFFFKLLVDKYSEGSYTLKLKGDGELSGFPEEASIHSIHSKNKISFPSKNNPIEVKIDITLDGFIREFTGDKLSQAKIKEIEKQMKEDIEKNSNDLIARFLELKIDPIGIGHRLKTKKRGFDFKKWDEDYPNIKVTIVPHVKILESGTIE